MAYYLFVVLFVFCLVTNQNITMSAEPEVAADSKPEGKQRRERKKDETPIEELFDLTQPIPRVSICVSSVMRRLASSEDLHWATNGCVVSDGAIPTMTRAY